MSDILSSDQHDDLLYGVASVLKEHLETEKGLEVHNVFTRRSRTKESEMKKLMKKGMTRAEASEEAGLSSEGMGDVGGVPQVMSIEVEVTMPGLFRKPVTYKTWIEYRKHRTSPQWRARIKYSLL